MGTISKAVRTLIVVAPVCAQSLVADINPRVDQTRAGITAARLEDPTGLVWFSATSATHGDEVWVTDGTEPGTRLVADLVPGSASSEPRGLAQLGGGLLCATGGRGVFWFHRDGSDIRRIGNFPNRFVGPMVVAGGVAFFTDDTSRLFASDGTVAGTIDLGVTIQRRSDGQPQLHAYQDRAWFIADALSPRRLWSSDGSVAGTSEFGAGIPYGQVAEMLAMPQYLALATFGGAWAGSAELWRCDGTIGGTRALRQTFVHEFVAGIGVFDLTRWGDRLVFTGLDPVTYFEPWVSDGTAEGTRMIADLVPNPARDYERPARFLPIGDRLLFTVGQSWPSASRFPRWFSSDGTASGTVQIADFSRVGTGFSPRLSNVFAVAGQAMILSDVYFEAPHFWVSDGTPTGTRNLGDLIGSAPIATFRLWSSNRLGSNALLAYDDGSSGVQPYVTDATPSGTRRIALFGQVPAGSQPEEFGSFGRSMIFRADDGLYGTEPYITNAAASTARRLGDLVFGGTGSLPEAGFVLGDRYLFSAVLPAAPWQLFEVDACGGVRIANWAPAMVSTRNPTASVGDKAVVTSGPPGFPQSLWRVDGSSAGTTRLDPDSSVPARPGYLAAFDDAFVFDAMSATSGRELWLARASSAVVELVSDLSPGVASSTFTGLSVNGGKIWFGAGVAVAPPTVPDVELWVSEGSASSTRRVADVFPGPTASNPHSLCAFGDRILFLGRFDLSGRQALFISDGSETGTVALGAVSTAEEFVVAGDRVWFTGTDGLFVSDGTVANTRRLEASREWIGLRGLTSLGSSGDLACIASTPAAGAELWICDHRSLTATQIDLLPGQASGVPRTSARRSLHRVLGNLFVTVDDATYGREPFVVSLASLGRPLVEVFGRACAASDDPPRLHAMGNPRIGTSELRLALSGATPEAPALLAFTPSLAEGIELHGCSIGMDASVILEGFTTDRGGHAQRNLSIPLDPQLVGAELFTRWFVYHESGGVLPGVAASEYADVILGR